LSESQANSHVSTHNTSKTITPENGVTECFSDFFFSIHSNTTAIASTTDIAITDTDTTANKVVAGTHSKAQFAAELAGNKSGQHKLVWVSTHNGHVLHYRSQNKRQQLKQANE